MLAIFLCNKLFSLSYCVYICEGKNDLPVHYRSFGHYYHTMSPIQLVCPNLIYMYIGLLRSHFIPYEYLYISI